MACKKMFVDPNSNLKGICFNYPDTKEELISFTENFQETLVTILEMKFGENWATNILKMKQVNIQDLNANIKKEENAVI